MLGGGGAFVLIVPFRLISRPPALVGWGLVGGVSAVRWGASQTCLRIAHSQEARGSGGGGGGLGPVLVWVFVWYSKPRKKEPTDAGGDKEGGRG